MKTYDKIYHPKVDTNFCCAMCVNAVDGCAWSKSFQPVPGWRIIPTQNRDRDDGIKILFCPEFKEGDPLDDRALNDEGLMNFASAIFSQAASDYKAAVKRRVMYPYDTDTKRTLAECEMFLGKHAARLKQQALAELESESNK